MNKSVFVYVTFIRTTPERLWAALTSPQFIQQYWFGMLCESDFENGAAWRLRFPDGRLADAGEIAEASPPHRLIIKWQNEWKPELKAEGGSRCTFDIEAVPEASPAVVKLTVTHAMDRPGSKFIEAVSGGWPRILSNLKSLLETGDVPLKASKSAA